MGFGGNRISTAKEALALFIRSLPKDSKFSVISFGSHFDSLMPEVMTFDDESMNRAVGQIADFSANYGGT